MIPLIEREVVEKRHWISEKDLVDLIAISQSLPGVFAINLSTFIGQRQRGRLGAIASAIGCALPSFLVILAIAAGLARYQQLAIVQHFFIGVRAAVTAQILLATLKMGRQIVKDKVTALIALMAWVLVIAMDLHPVLTVLGGAAAGLACTGWHLPTRAGSSSRHKRAVKRHDPLAAVFHFLSHRPLHIWRWVCDGATDPA
ncbi:MAG: chromate transporter [Clostridiales bacterium]|nr:chromate transporter [Clostridiales bacterium]